jgi:hypothetical protein
MAVFEGSSSSLTSRDRAATFTASSFKNNNKAAVSRH